MQENEVFFFVIFQNSQDNTKPIVQQKYQAAQPSSSKAAVVIKEEDSQNDSTDRTHFVLVTKPKFIKMESGNDNSTPSSPRKTQNVTLETDDDDDVAMKTSQSPDEGKRFFFFNLIFCIRFTLLTLSIVFLGIRRKHCNCNKSMCLKLYCDCFANGEFCYNCNCKECFNNLENEEERQRAIRICLERNPAAFK